MTPGPPLLQLRQRLASTVAPVAGDDAAARRQWWAGLTVLQEQLLELGCPPGLWLASPLPALHEPQVLSRCPGWVWSPAGWSQGQRELPGHLHGKQAQDYG